MSSVILTKLTPSSIRTQLTLWYLLMLAGALAAFAVFVFYVRAQALYGEGDAALQVHTQRVLRDLRSALLELNVPAALADDDALSGEPVTIRERSGGAIFRSASFPTLTGPGEAIAARAARGADDVVDVEDRSGGRLRLATIVAERTGTSPLMVQMVASTDPIRRTLRQLAATLAVMFIIVLAVASYGGSFIARRALRPFEAINARMRDIQASSLGERIELQSGCDEIDSLVTTLNGMLDRLDASVAGARRFAGDASHELQTPIAAMRAALDMCTRGVRSEADYGALAVDLASDLDRLSTLVRDLRLLALADAGHLVERVERVDLTAVVRECCDIVRAIAEPRTVDVTLEVRSNITVSGSALHLRRALLNVAQNAVRYSGDGSTVLITLGRIEHEAVIAIADEGCGISADDLPHIFDRFYRADPARARDTGGSGLGLAIADQIVRIHGGRIDVTSAVGEGSTFLMFLPLTAADDSVGVSRLETILNTA